MVADEGDILHDVERGAEPMGSDESYERGGHVDENGERQHEDDEPSRQKSWKAEVKELFQKGAIAAGSDADIVLFDPDIKKTLTLDDLHADSDYSIWEGFECHGYPVLTMLRGKVIVEDGRLLGSSSDGRWLPRRVAPGVLAQPVV